MFALLLVSLLHQAPSGRIVATVTNVRSTRGTVRCNLFDGPTGFPGKATRVGRHLAAMRVEGHTVCEFNNVPAGTYAVVVIHDENDNDAFDTNFFGVPKEGYGVSNNVIPTLSAPTWEASRFSLADGQHQHLDITLTY